jgi:hydroxymethylglutaryl-CoA lyase
MAELKKALIAEVGTRDGFQNVREFIPTDKKIAIARALLDSGIKMMNLTSFVSPKAIPQLADAKEVSAAILPDYPDVRFNALIPNLKGAVRAAESGYREVVYVISVSESHNRNNIRQTHEQSMTELEHILSELPQLKVTVGLATAFGCPFEGETSLEKFLAVARWVYDRGVRSFELSDTIGVAYPTQVVSFIHAFRREFPDTEFGVHIHDTRNMGILNSYLALENGAAFAHSTVGGLGGCPFAPGASGNTCTEDLVYMLNKCGVETGIDFDRLMIAARLTKSIVKGNYSGHQLTIDGCGCG